MIREPDGMLHRIRRKLRGASAPPSVASDPIWGSRFNLHVRLADTGGVETDRKPDADPEAGTSLVELMLTVSVVLVMLAGTLTGVVYHQRQRQITMERQLAMVACRNTLEQIRGVDVAVLPSLDGRGFDVPGTNGAPGGLSPVAGDPDGLAGEITVRPADTFGGTTIYYVSTRVVWLGAGPNNVIQLEALVGERR